MKPDDEKNDDVKQEEMSFSANKLVSTNPFSTDSKTNEIIIPIDTIGSTTSWTTPSPTTCQKEIWTNTRR